MKQKIKRDTLLYKFFKRLHKPYVKVSLFINRRILKKAIFIDESELPAASLFPKQIIDRTIIFFNPKTVLDLGCGTGKSLDYFLEKGLEVVGVEGSGVAAHYAKHPELIKLYDLEKELDLHRKFDLIWSFEFVEHIHPRHVDNLIKTFSNHSDKIVMSAAPPGQGGDGHFNEQPASYWIEQFKRYGYSFDESRTNQLRELNEDFARNMLVFER